MLYKRSVFRSLPLVATMLRVTTVAAGLLACLTLVSALHNVAHFPRGRTVVYKYTADVKAGIIEPSPYASQFDLEALLYVKYKADKLAVGNVHEYYFMFDNIKYGLFNGRTVHHEHIMNNHPLPETVLAMKEPFLVVHNTFLEGYEARMRKTDTEWSKNIKQALVSMLQLSLASFDSEQRLRSPQSFIKREFTVHGYCDVTYDVQPKDPSQLKSSNVSILTKLYEPKGCTDFKRNIFDHVECMDCRVERQDDMSTASRRVFEIEDQDDNILIKKVIGHSVINYFPWSHRSEAHYLLTNQTLVYVEDVPESKIYIPHVDSRTDYEPSKLAFDIAIHRRHSKSDNSVSKVQKILYEAADYIKENHIEMKEPDYKHGQTINRLLQAMSYLNGTSLQELFQTIKDAITPREISIRNIFLQMIPHVGTNVSCQFALSIIRKRQVPDTIAIMILSKLPAYVWDPTEELLTNMKDLINLVDTVPLEVRKAGILCLASMIDKIFPASSNSSLKYIEHFSNNAMNNSQYEMQLVYLKAMGNIRHYRVVKDLYNIIQEKDKYSDKIRLHSIIAIGRSLEKDKEMTFKLMWPVLADTSLPVQLRMSAYDILIKQLPNMQRMMNIYWLMVYEKNEHLYNYHYTTLKSLANSVEPCMRPVAEMARKILRFTRVRPVSSDLSSQFIVGYNDPKYGHGQNVKVTLMLNELTGLPQVVKLDTYTSIARKLFHEVGIELYIEGADTLLQSIMGTKVPVTNSNVKEILSIASQDIRKDKHVAIDICLKSNDKVILASHFDKETLWKLAETYADYSKIMSELNNLNWQQIIYHNLFEMHTTTDIGVHAVMGTKIPNLFSLKVNTFDLVTSPNLRLKVQMDIRSWRHGQYFMELQNPISNTWHGIRRITTTDTQLPIDFTLEYNPNNNSLHLILPRLPVTDHSVAGIVVFAKNYVTVTEDDNDVLKKHCASCLPYEVVTKGTDAKKYYHNDLDSKDTGTRYSSTIFNCESGLTPVTRVMEYYRVFSENNKYTWNSRIVQTLLSVTQQIFNDMNYQPSGTCGFILKAEPSLNYATSEIEINVRTNIQDLDEIQRPWHILKGKKIHVHGVWKVKAAASNMSVRAWEMHVNGDISEGRVTQDLKVILTRIIPNKENLTICIDAEKIYPNHTRMDMLKIDATKEVINGKITLKMGYTNEQTCSQDIMDVKITFKNKMTDDQKKIISQERKGPCMRDMQNPIYQNSEGLVPKTPGCLTESIKLMTLRQSTINVAYKKVPQNVLSYLQEMENFIRAYYLPHIEYLTNYTEIENAKILVEFPVGTNNVDVTVITPSYSYKLNELPLGHPVWNVLMDNVRFSMPMLSSYYMGHTVLCTVYPKILVTPENATVEVQLPSEWTLLSGDHYQQTFAIFAKTVYHDKVAMMIFTANHKVEVTPEDRNIIVKVDGKVVDDYENGIIVPAGNLKNYVFRITKSYDHLAIQFGNLLHITIFYSTNSVSIILDRFMLRSHVSGLCGRLTDFHVKNPSVIHKTTAF